MCTGMQGECLHETRASAEDLYFFVSKKTVEHDFTDYDYQSLILTLSLEDMGTKWSCSLLNILQPLLHK